MAGRIAVLLGLILAARAAFAEPFRSGQVVMGTILNLSIEAPDPARARRLAEAVLGAARRWDDVLTTWRPEGELAGLNRRRGQWTRIGPDLQRALGQMREMSRMTRGAFDPTVGPLVDAWRSPNEPSTRALASIPIGIGKVLETRHGSARLRQGAALDAGGIGKGIALDEARKILGDGGATSAFLDFGGSSQMAFLAQGQAQDGWTLAIAGLESGSVLGILQITSGSVSTSRSSPPGEPAGPIVDPRTRRTIQEARIVTVVAPSATAADAWSTALVVLGREGLEIARRSGIQALLEDARGVAMTPGFPIQRVPTQE